MQTIFWFALLVVAFAVGASTDDLPIVIAATLSTCACAALGIRASDRLSAKWLSTSSEKAKWRNESRYTRAMIYAIWAIMLALPITAWAGWLQWKRPDAWHPPAFDSLAVSTGELRKGGRSEYYLSRASEPELVLFCADRGGAGRRAKGYLLRRCAQEDLDRWIGKQVLVRHDRPAWTGRYRAPVYGMQAGVNILIDPVETYERLNRNRQSRATEGGAWPIFTTTMAFCVMLGFLPIQPRRLRPKPSA